MIQERKFRHATMPTKTSSIKLLEAFRRVKCLANTKSPADVSCYVHGFALKNHFLKIFTIGNYVSTR